MNLQQDQQITYKYLFVITPLQIKSNLKVKTNNAKAILIKLGNKTAKCTEMNVPLQLEVDVLYSKTLQKYCSIKGIIKIYDISEDGSEIISCVGGFQTDQLLNQSKNNVIIEKQLGTSKLKMEINIVNKSSTKKIQEKNVPVTRENSAKESISSRDKYLMGRKSPSDKANIPTTRTNPNPNPNPHTQVARKNSLISNQGYAAKNVQIPYKNTSSNINKSLQKINQALNFKRFEQNPISTKANQVLSKAQIQTLKQQINDQRRKSFLLQDRLTKANSKINSYKSVLSNCQNQSKMHYQLFKRLINQLQINDNKPNIELNQTTKSAMMKYKDKHIEQSIQELIEIALKKIKDYSPITDLDIDSCSKDRNFQELSEYKKEVANLKKFKAQNQKKIFSLQKQLQGIEMTIHNLKQTNKHLNEQNNYLREKNDQIELSLYHKESTIENLRKEIERYSYETHELENKLYNSGLQNEQLKEEVDNCNDTIQQYREKYGDLKNVKNRAIEMEIKECIRWIDQQNRDLEMSEMEDTMQSEHKDEKDDSLSSVIRNIELEKVPVEEMSIIREELVRILKKIDNLMTK